MTWQIVKLDDVPPTPWRNGGGVTRELLAWPRQDAWDVRISVAEVASDGPFSRFDEVTRWLAILRGAGVRLQRRGGPQRLTPDDPPMWFYGESPVDCELLDGPVRDLNLMVRNAAGRGHMGHFGTGDRIAVAAGEFVAWFATTDACELAGEIEQLGLPPWHLAWQVAKHADHWVVRDGRALWHLGVTAHED